MLAVKNIHSHKCTNYSQHNLNKKFNPISEWEADVINACPNPECIQIEIIDDVCSLFK